MSDAKSFQTREGIRQVHSNRGRVPSARLSVASPTGLLILRTVALALRLLDKVEQNEGPERAHRVWSPQARPSAPTSA